MDDPSWRNGRRWLRALALVVMVGGYVAFVRANGAEASAIFDAGGDAGMWGVGIIFVTALLAPSAVLLLLSLALSPRSNRSAAVAVAAGLALLAPTAWLWMNLYPPDRKTDEGLPLAAAQWDQVAHFYLLSFVLMSAAGALLLLSAIPSPDRAGRSPASRDRGHAAIDR